MVDWSIFYLGIYPVIFIQHRNLNSQRNYLKKTEQNPEN